MLNPTNYAVAWGLYLACALGFYLLSWPLLNKIGLGPLRKFLKGLLAVILFTPAMTVPSENLMAPATLVLIFEAAQGHQDLAIQAGMLLALALTAVFCMMLLDALFRRLLQPRTEEN